MEEVLYEEFQEWLNQCPIKITNYEDNVNEFAVDFKIEVDQMKYIPLVLSGIVVIVGINVALAIRDSKMLDKIEERNTTIEKLLQQV